MAIRRKTNTAEGVRAEQAKLEDLGQNRREGSEGWAADGNGQDVSEPRSNVPVRVEPMSQRRNAADLEDRIRRRAYEIYEARGRENGRADEDWLLAEEEITGITGGG